MPGPSGSAAGIISIEFSLSCLSISNFSPFYASFFWWIRAQVVTCLMKMVQSLLNVKDVPTLELTYG